MRRNLFLFPHYLILIRLDCWQPVFFLYFSSLFSLDRVLLLEALYYISVVLLEVPSGYFSDRLGRKASLVIAAGAGALSGAVFACTKTFAAFCIAQFLYAVFMAFNSGSDTALLYDTLKAQGRENDMLAQEARAHSRAWFWGAFASVGAGAVALWGYRSVYFLSALAYGGAFIVALLFVEPPQSGRRAEKTLSLQLKLCRERLSDGMLKWIFLFYVGRTIFEHVPYEFIQPYLGFVIGTSLLPLAAGGHLAVTKLVSSFAADRAPALTWSPTTTLLFTHGLTSVLILLMAFWVHPLVAVLLFLRNVPHGLGQPVMNAQIHPRVESGLRATYFSLQSLAGRLSFAVSLGVLSAWVGAGAIPDFFSLSKILRVMGAFSLIWLLGLLVGRPRGLSASPPA